MKTQGNLLYYLCFREASRINNISAYTAHFVYLPKILIDMYFLLVQCRKMVRLRFKAAVSEGDTLTVLWGTAVYRRFYDWSKMFMIHPGMHTLCSTFQTRVA